MGATTQTAMAREIGLPAIFAPAFLAVVALLNGVLWGEEMTLWAGGGRHARMSSTGRRFPAVVFAILLIRAGATHSTEISFALPVKRPSQDRVLRRIGVAFRTMCSELEMARRLVGMCKPCQWFQMRRIHTRATSTDVMQLVTRRNRADEHVVEHTMRQLFDAMMRKSTVTIRLTALPDAALSIRDGIRQIDLFYRYLTLAHPADFTMELA